MFNKGNHRSNGLTIQVSIGVYPVEIDDLSIPMDPCTFLDLGG